MTQAAGRPAPTPSQAGTRAELLTTLRTLPERMTNARQKKGWSRAQLAGRLGHSSGMATQVERWETHERSMRTGMLVKVAKLLDVSVDYCTGATEDPSPVPPLNPDRIIQARKDAGMERREVASRMSVSPEVIRCWEKGLYTPMPDRWAKLASVLKTNVEYLQEVDAAPPQPNGAAAVLPEPASKPAAHRGPPKDLEHVDGDVLRELRERAGLTRWGLADISGINKASLDCWENGRYTGCGQKRLKQVSAALNVDPLVMCGLAPLPDLSTQLAQQALGAVVDEGTVSDERAGAAERTEPQERAVRPERTDPDERADHDERTDIHEQAATIERTVDSERQFEPPTEEELAAVDVSDVFAPANTGWDETEPEEERAEEWHDDEEANTSVVVLDEGNGHGELLLIGGMDPRVRLWGALEAVNEASKEIAAENDRLKARIGELEAEAERQRQRFADDTETIRAMLSDISAGYRNGPVGAS
jgi:ribosome-binding protein aMBF1 (putative translation factor)